MSTSDPSRPGLRSDALISSSMLDMFIPPRPYARVDVGRFRNEYTEVPSCADIFPAKADTNSMVSVTDIYFDNEVIIS